MNKWRLSRRPSMIEDESLEGFLVRVSQINGYEDIDDHSKFRYHYSPVLNQIKKNKKFILNDYILYDLAEVLTGQEIIRRNHDRKYLSSRGLLIGHGSVGYPRLTRYCPLCLQESKYHRIQWSMIPVVVCDKHLCFLRHKCHECDHFTNLKATITGICNRCERDITVQYDKVTREFLFEHPFLVNIDYLSDKRVFLHLTGGNLFKLKKWLIFCIVNINDKKKKSLWIQYSTKSTVIRMTDFDIEKINDYLILTDNLISNWPENIIKYANNNMILEERQHFINTFFKRKHSYGNMDIINFLNRIKVNS